MKSKAAVLREFGQPLSIEELEVEPPKEKEVLVKNAYSGFCHSDFSVVKGQIPLPLPMITGHEAAGVVQEVGPGVTKVKKGDHVVATWMIPCGQCPNCLRGRGNICSTNMAYFMMGTLLDGTSRFKDAQGQPVMHEAFVAGFSEYTVLPEAGAIPLPNDFPLDQACAMGCCVPTGWGSVINVAKVQPGNSVAVYGMGAVGLNTVSALAHRNANPIIAVDLEGRKEDIAREFGATHFVDSSKEAPVPVIMTLTGGVQAEDGYWVSGGADFVFEVSGDPGALVQAYWSICPGGKTIVTGIPPAESASELPLMLLALQERSIIGHLYGSISPGLDIPALVNIAQGGEMKLDKLIEKKFKIEAINETIEAMDKRQIKGRWVCEWD
jgi:S-(hydroxymethyl)glutathione dehydrogenase/alcohol dehydrogenase